MRQPADYLDDLFAFLAASPTAFHAATNGAARLSQHGFQPLREQDDWGKLAPGAYYLLRNDASLIALTLTGGMGDGHPLRMAGAHTDSPGLKIKPNPMQLRHTCVQLGAEVYGGALLTPWFDRDLSLAGRVSWIWGSEPLQCHLINFKRPVAIIPSLAIHLDREANSGRTIDKQNDLVPICLQSTDTTAPDFKALLLEQLVREHPVAEGGEIVDFDLFLYDVQPPARVGFQGDFIASSRLDNLLSCHALLTALISVPERRDCLVVLNNHEEVGSVSTAGAQGPFLRDVLERLCPEAGQRQRMLSQSLFLSVDNAHAVHPNHGGKHDPGHLPLLNHGPVIKMNANQRYATDGLTAGLFKRICVQAGIPCQQFVMRNDLACGSTIGPLTAAGIGVPTVDIGAPQLAMHSLRETTGHLDGWHLFQALTAYFSEPDTGITCPAIIP